MKDSWSWIEDIRLSNRTKGIILVAVPSFIILISVVYWYLTLALFTSAKSSIIGITITNPSGDFLSSTAQILVGLGICLLSICCGVSKIIKSMKV